jgi:coenzyme F420-reducing hydrogenase gamma subunit
LAVWKFASCDGCQLSVLDLEDELLDLATAVDIAWFPEASSDLQPGPYDLSLVEGSISTSEDVERIHDIRRRSTTLLTIGSCATAGGIQALRNGRDLGALAAKVYPNPQWLDALDRSDPIAAHVRVDLELTGCPIDRHQLLEVLTAVLAGRQPRLPANSVCFECKTRGATCVTVAAGVPCLGPATRAGCGALCPSFNRGCYGCFGPMETPNLVALGPPRGAFLEALHGAQLER